MGVFFVWLVVFVVWYPLGLPPSIEARSCLELALSCAVLILSCFVVLCVPCFIQAGCSSPFNGRTDGG